MKSQINKFECEDIENFLSMHNSINIFRVLPQLEIGWDIKDKNIWILWYLAIEKKINKINSFLNTKSIWKWKKQAWLNMTSHIW